VSPTTDISYPLGRVWVSWPQLIRNLPPSPLSRPARAVVTHLPRVRPPHKLRDSRLEREWRVGRGGKKDLLAFLSFRSDARSASPPRRLFGRQQVLSSAHARARTSTYPLAVSAAVSSAPTHERAQAPSLTHTHIYILFAREKLLLGDGVPTERRRARRTDLDGEQTFGDKTVAISKRRRFKSQFALLHLAPLKK